MVQCFFCEHQHSSTLKVPICEQFRTFWLYRPFSCYRIRVPKAQWEFSGGFSCQKQMAEWSFKVDSYTKFTVCIFRPPASTSKECVLHHVDIRDVAEAVLFAIWIFQGLVELPWAKAAYGTQFSLQEQCFDLLSGTSPADCYDVLSYPPMSSLDCVGDRVPLTPPNIFCCSSTTQSRQLRFDMDAHFSFPSIVLCQSCPFTPIERHNNCLCSRRPLSEEVAVPKKE